MPPPSEARQIKLDSQQVEILGRNKLKAALIEDGIEVATPERDNGIDLIAYRWGLSGEFTSRPVQMKAASEFSFGIDAKYHRIPGLILVFVMAVRRDDHAFYAMTYPELLEMADGLGWTKTPSWNDGGGYSTRHPAKRVMELLKPFEMHRGGWQRFFAHLA